MGGISNAVRWQHTTNGNVSHVHEQMLHDKSTSYKGLVNVQKDAQLQLWVDSNENHREYYFTTIRLTKKLGLAKSKFGCGAFLEGAGTDGTILESNLASPSYTEDEYTEQCSHFPPEYMALEKPWCMWSRRHDQESS